MTTIQRKSRILDELHETARGLHTSGLISAHRMAEYDALREGGGEDMPPEKIKRLREKEHLSQADLDTVLNTSISTIQKWGIGHQRPNGPSRRLLSLIERKGLEAIL
jgi:putative transcriptional regulator